MLIAFDLIELEGEELHRTAIEQRKRKLAKLVRAGLTPALAQRDFRRRRRYPLRARLQARLRGHRIEAARLAVPRRPIGALVQDQEPGRAGRAAARRGRLGIGLWVRHTGSKWAANIRSSLSNSTGNYGHCAH